MLSVIYLLPAILPRLAPSSGAIILRIEYMIPLAIFPTIFTSFASGLYFLLQAGSATGKSVGFQIIGGIGSGAGLHVALSLSKLLQ
ncbi:hypothetical protein ACMFMG_011743 [Clarireedia jacksonii]